MTEDASPSENLDSANSQPVDQSHPVEQRGDGIAAPVPGAGLDRAAARKAAREAAARAAAEAAENADSEAVESAQNAEAVVAAEAALQDANDQSSPRGQRILQEVGTFGWTEQTAEQLSDHTEGDEEHVEQDPAHADDIFDQSSPHGQAELQHHGGVIEDFAPVEVPQSRPAPAERPCRHEYVKIYQRKLKGLERRLVATKAWLPVGFKPTDFGHLSEGSYCFCSKCRARLYPRRTAAEKAAARLALAQGKADAEAAEQEALMAGEAIDSDAAESGPELHVEELELESVDVQDIQAEGVKLSDDEESCSLTDDEDI